MIAVRTMKQIATSRALSSVRSGRTVNRDDHSGTVNQGRTMLGYEQVLTNEAHRKWRNGLWQVRR